MRSRDLGIVIGRGRPGPLDAITDVPGVHVGHTTLISGDGPLVVGQGPVRTGVTVVVPLPLLASLKPDAAKFNGRANAVFAKTDGVTKMFDEYVASMKP